MTFDLWFNQKIETKEVEKQLGAGLQIVGGALVIDTNTIQITGECYDLFEGRPSWSETWEVHIVLVKVFIVLMMV